MRSQSWYLTDICFLHYHSADKLGLKPQPQIRPELVDRPEQNATRNSEGHHAKESDGHSCCPSLYWL